MGDLATLADALADWRQLTRTHALSCWRAWDGGPGKTSQQAALRALTRAKTLLVFGGNRSGKTEFLRAVLVALALGADHPDAIAFWAENGIDPSHFPKGPGRVYLVARSSNDSLRYHRKQVDRLLPRSPNGEGVQWWNINGRGEARCEIEVPGYEAKAEIWFKSEDQGDDAIQGDSARAIGHDEEGDTPAVWDEATVRLWDQQGWQIMSNTPVKGRTWVYDRFVRDGAPEGAETLWIHSLDNPFLPPEQAMKLAKGSKALAAARLRGEFVTLKGRVWPEFSRGVHAVEPFDIPLSWPRYRAIDFGTRNPFVCTWAALSPDDVLYVYREHYLAGATLSQHVKAIRVAEGWVYRRGGELVPGPMAEPIEMTWADPEDPQQLMQLGVDHDLMAAPASNAVAAGIDEVAERLRSGGLYVFSTVANGIREVENYVWAEGVGTKDAPDRPLKKDDHTCDTWRYLAMGVRLER